MTRFADFEAYWTTRGYDAEAPIKFSSRIDVPRVVPDLPGGSGPRRRVAWAQTVGIERSRSASTRAVADRAAGQRGHRRDLAPVELGVG